MSEKEKMITTKCEHKTTSILGYHDNVSLEVCDWGCGAILVSVTDDNGTNHEFTADELLALRERVAALQTALGYSDWIFDRMGEAKIADLHFDYGNRQIGVFDFDGELVAEVETLARGFELAHSAKDG